jgi:hypothetical protein
MISPGTRDPVFSLDRKSYEYFTRVRSSLKDEADAILSMYPPAHSRPSLARSRFASLTAACCAAGRRAAAYGWTSIVLWHSSSQFGTSLTPSFSGTGIEVVDVPVRTRAQRAAAACIVL